MNVGSLVFSPKESSRFGLKVFRAQPDTFSGHSILKAIIAGSIDIAIIRTPVGGGAELQVLTRFGMQPIHADTLVYYETELRSTAEKLIRNADISFSLAKAEDESELTELVRVTFKGYRSHYHANPMLSPDDILEGYAEWASGYTAAGQEGRAVWVARRDGQIIAFACCTHDSAAGACEGILYGVHPDHAGGGLYGDLIRYTQNHYRNAGFQRMRVSTQIWNFAVQKVWARENFRLSEVFETYHVNALLSGGHLLIDRTVTFTTDQVVGFAAATGDDNPVHLDANSARAAGFDGKLSHGMLTGGLLSKIFGTEQPGPGTLFLRADLVFLKPIYADCEHRVQVRYLSELPLTGPVKAIATVHDMSGMLCLVSYNDLLVRQV